MSPTCRMRSICRRVGPRPGTTAPDGAAVITGTVHAATEQARTVIDIALRWSHKTPRRAALKQLVTWGEHNRARALAADDSDPTIRAWGRTLRPEVDPQTSLFD
jgi:hypothetical protein